MNPNLRDFLIGLLVAVIGGAINGAAVAAATGFTFDAVHLKAIAAAAFAGGLINASMYLRQPVNGLAIVRGEASQPVQPVQPVQPALPKAPVQPAPALPPAAPPQP